MNRRAAFLAPLIALTCLMGCGSRESKFVGEWKGEIEIPQRLKDDPKAQFLLAKIDTKAILQLNENKTFVLKINKVPNEGTWTLDKKDLVLKVEKVAGVPWEQLKTQTDNSTKAPKGMLENATDTVHFRIGDDDKSLTIIPGGTTNVQGNLTLHK